jgi:FtsP/CotA-like multicopper oxidase with cupredoxin domain
VKVLARASIAASALALACAPSPTDDVADRELRELVPAVDIDPDPTVTEIELVAEVASFEYVPGVSTEVWAYRDANGDAVARVPGPMIEAEVGQTLVVHLTNALPEPTTIHWHGVRVPNDMDGNPMVSGMIEPGTSFTYRFTLQDAGTFWYHPHVSADQQVERGLHAVLVVRDPSEPPVDRERVLVLDDIDLAADGALVLDADETDLELGRHGNTLLVNGGLPGTIRATAGTIERWRIVDVANGRHFDLALGDRELQVVGGDGGLVAQPYATDELAIVPGERHDVIVAIGSDDHGIELRSSPDHADPPGSVPWTLALLDVDGSASAPAVPSFGRTIEPLPVDATTAIRGFELRADLERPEAPYSFINDQRWPLNNPVHVQQGVVEIWEITNTADHMHPFHVHGMFAQVIDESGAPIEPVAWKDTIDIPDDTTVRLALRYDALGMWMYHCTILEHAERGMMGDLHVMEGE